MEAHHVRYQAQRFDDSLRIDPCAVRVDIYIVVWNNFHDKFLHIWPEGSDDPGTDNCQFLEVSLARNHPCWASQNDRLIKIQHKCERAQTPSGKIVRKVLDNGRQTLLNTSPGQRFVTWLSQLCLLTVSCLPSR